MHRTAEYGIAAHWKYKEASDGKKSGPEQEEAKLSWLRQILEWQQDMSDNREFMSLLKSDLDLFCRQCVLLLPGGRREDAARPDPAPLISPIPSIRRWATAWWEPGSTGKLVPIETELHNGDRVAIITSQNSRGPSRDWLKVVKSTQAKNRINQWFRQELKEDNIIKGKEMLSSYAKLKGKTLGLSI